MSFCSELLSAIVSGLAVGGAVLMAEQAARKRARRSDVLLKWSETRRRLRHLTRRPFVPRGMKFTEVNPCWDGWYETLENQPLESWYENVPLDGISQASEFRNCYADFVNIGATIDSQLERAIYDISQSTPFTIETNDPELVSRAMRMILLERLTSMDNPSAFARALNIDESRVHRLLPTITAVGQKLSGSIYLNQFQNDYSSLRQSGKQLLDFLLLKTNMDDLKREAQTQRKNRPRTLPEPQVFNPR